MDSLNLGIPSTEGVNLDITTQGGELNLGIDPIVSDESWKGTAPAFDTSAEEKKLTNGVKVTGFIAPRYDYLRQTHDTKASKEAYKALYKEQAEKNELTYTIMKQNSSGELEPAKGTGTLTENFSIQAIRSLRPEVYEQLRDGVYAVTLAERKEEFLVVTNFEVLQSISKGELNSNDLTSLTLQDKASATSEDSVVSIFKTETLLKLMLSTETEILEIVEFDHSVSHENENLAKSMRKLGILTLEGKDKKVKGVVRFQPIPKLYDNTLTEVTSIGDFRTLPRAVNRDYRGDRPNYIKSIDNIALVKKVAPHLVVDGDQVVSTLTLKKEPIPSEANQPSQRKQEEIPYADQEEKWRVLGVTETMLNHIRATGSGSKKQITYKEINKTFKEAIAMFMQQKKTEQGAAV